ncbi:hypothetical protein ACFC0P_47895, partial [Streptomyces broussonetiae]
MRGRLLPVAVRRAGHGLRRIALHDREPVHPHSPLWHRGNPHPALTALRRHLHSGRFALFGARPGPRPGNTVPEGHFRTHEHRGEH